MKKELIKMVEALIEDDSTIAALALHNHLNNKMRKVLEMDDVNPADIEFDEDEDEDDIKSDKDSTDCDCSCNDEDDLDDDDAESDEDDSENIELI